MEQQKAICPVLPEMPCARGARNARECLQRLEEHFDPVAHIGDYLMLQCALSRAQEQKTTFQYQQRN